MECVHNPEPLIPAGTGFGKEWVSPRGFKRCFSRAVLGLAAFLMTTAPIYAFDTRLDKILSEKRLRVGTTGDYKPFSYFDPAKGDFEGADIDMADALARSLSAELVFVRTTWSDLMGDLLAGKFDIAMGGISISLDRQRHADFSVPYMTDGKVPITRCADAGKYQSLESIDQTTTRVIENPGGTNEQFVKLTLKHAKVSIYPDNVTIFDELASGKADVMITDASETRFQQKQHPGILCAVNPDHPLSFSEMAYLLPRDLVWKAYVDQWLHQALMTGQAKSIMRKWLD